MTETPRWIGLSEAAELYDVGTRTVDPSTAEYLETFVDAGMLAGRRVDGLERVEIRSDALEVLIERDLEAFIRQGDDEEELSA